MITLVPLHGKMLWMDSTEEVAPIGVLIGLLRDKQALAIPVRKPALLSARRRTCPIAQSARFEVEGKLSGPGSLYGAHCAELSRGYGTMLDATFRSVPQSQWKLLMQQFSNATGFGGEVNARDFAH